MSSVVFIVAVGFLVRELSLFSSLAALLRKKTEEE